MRLSDLAIGTASSALAYSLPSGQTLSAAVAVAAFVGLLLMLPKGRVAGAVAVTLAVAIVLLCEPSWLIRRFWKDR